MLLVVAWLDDIVDSVAIGTRRPRLAVGRLTFPRPSSCGLESTFTSGRLSLVLLFTIHLYPRLPCLLAYHRSDSRPALAQGTLVKIDGASLVQSSLGSNRRAKGAHPAVPRPGIFYLALDLSSRLGNPYLSHQLVSAAPARNIGPSNGLTYLSRTFYLRLDRSQADGPCRLVTDYRLRGLVCRMRPQHLGLRYGSTRLASQLGLRIFPSSDGGELSSLVDAAYHLHFLD